MTELCDALLLVCFWLLVMVGCADLDCVLGLVLVAVGVGWLWRFACGYGGLLVVFCLRLGLVLVVDFVVVGWVCVLRW